MALLNEKTLKEELRSGVAGAWLIYGDEDYLKKVYTEKMINAAVDKNFADFNLHTFDGGEADLGEIYDACEAFPMMGDTTCVVVNDMELCSLDDEGLDFLKELVTGCPDTCALIFIMKTAKTSGEKWNKIIKIFEKGRGAVKLQRKAAEDLPSIIEKGAAKRGVPFEKGVASYLVECVGNDLNTVYNETDKLCAYCYGRSVTRKDVDEICAKSLDAKVFDIIKNLHADRYEKAVIGMNELFVQREEPIMIIGAFIMSYVDMYRARCAVAAGLRPADAAQYYDYKGNNFRLEGGARNARGMSITALRKCIECLAKADEMLKSSSVDQRVVLEQTLTKLAVIEGNER